MIQPLRSDATRDAICGPVCRRAKLFQRLWCEGWTPLEILLAYERAPLASREQICPDHVHTPRTQADVLGEIYRCRDDARRAAGGNVLSRQSLSCLVEGVEA
jgi:hypothetical protein